MSVIHHNYFFSNRPSTRRLFRLSPEHLQSMMVEVEREEKRKQEELQRKDAARGVEIRGEMTQEELTAYQQGGAKGLREHQRKMREQQEEDTALLEREDIVEPVDTTSSEYTQFHGAIRRQLEREATSREDFERIAEIKRRDEEEQRAEIKKLLHEIHQMIAPEAAQEEAAMEQHAARRKAERERVAAGPTDDEQWVGRSLDWQTGQAGSFMEQEERKNQLIDDFIAEAAREQVTIDGKKFRDGQEVVYTDRQGNRMIMRVQIPERLAKGSLALTGEKENKRGVMQRLNFAIDREAVHARIDTDVEKFRDEQENERLEQAGIAA